MKRDIMRRAAWLLLALGVITMAGSTADAQNISFQGLYGRAWNDAAQGGIVMTSTASYMVVGYSDSTFAVPTMRDVYVAHILRCGTLDWARTYDLGGFDVGRKIRRTPDNGYVIVGDTENRDNDNCKTRNDIFLMKIDAAGNVQWVQTYGGKEVDEGYDVQLLGNGFLIAGRTKSFGAGDWDGILISTNSLGAVNWARTYGGTADDGFYSCAVDGDEAVAVGYARSFTFPQDMDVFLERIATGTGLSVTGFPLHYGGDGDDVGRSIVICPNSDLAIAGHTTSVGGGVEGYLLRTLSTGGVVADRAYGGLTGNYVDEFHEIQNANDDEFIVTGFLTDAPNGFGSQDMYVGHFDAGLNDILHTVHGSNGRETGYSIVQDLDQSLPAPQWIAAGDAVKGFVPGIASAVYVVRQWYSGESGCYDATPLMAETTPRFSRIPILLTPPEITVGCRSTSTPILHDEYDILCQQCMDSPLRFDTPDLSDRLETGSRMPVSVVHRDAER